MRSLVVVLALLLGACSSQSFRPYSGADLAREVVYAGVVAVDVGQSMDIKNHPGLVEANPIISRISGNRPSDEEFAWWGTGTIVLHALATWALPPSARPWWQYLTIGVHGGVVLNNAQIGLSVNY